MGGAESQSLPVGMIIERKVVIQEEYILFWSQVSMLSMEMKKTDICMAKKIKYIGKVFHGLLS